jgi:hypothetical protein
MRLTGRQVRMHANVAANGVVKGTVDGLKFGPEPPMSGTFEGVASNGRIDIEGRWDNGARFQGHWEVQP